MAAAAAAATSAADSSVAAAVAIAAAAGGAGGGYGWYEMEYAMGWGVTEEVPVAGATPAVPTADGG